MTTVVITGATGFLGSFLMAHLANKGLNMIPVTRQALPGMHQVQDYSHSPSGDVLIHLAEEPDRGTANRLGEKYVLHSANVIKALSGRSSYQKIIYASSATVYGNENVGLCRIDKSVSGTDVYSRSKLLNEQIVLDAGGCVARLSNIFGSGMASNNVLSDIIRQIPNSGPLHVRDDKPVCDFLPAPDAVSALGLMVKSNYGGIMNVGSGIGTSVRTLAKTLLVLSGQADREVLAMTPSSKPSRNVLDISETKKILGWMPEFSLQDQLSKLLLSWNQASQ